MHVQNCCLPFTITELCRKVESLWLREQQLCALFFIALKCRRHLGTEQCDFFKKDFSIGAQKVRRCLKELLGSVCMVSFMGWSNTT